MMEPTRRELLWQLRGLKATIVRQMGNRPPAVVVWGGGLHRVPYGEGKRPLLWAGGSADPDSTPGTNDDIASYRWYDQAGNLVGDEDHLIATVDPGEAGIRTYTYLVEVRDGYGAMSEGTAEVTVVGVAP